MEFITGVANKPHVTSMQHRAIYEMIIGKGSYILDKNELLEPELQSNNSLKIRSGMLAHHGGISEVKANTYDTVTIGNGSQGMKRVDLVVARYEKDPETSVETMEWKVIQGTPSEDTPVVPPHIVGNMQDGDLTDDCPAFQVHLDGIQVTEVKTLLPVLEGSLAELNSKLYTLTTGNLGGLGTRLYNLKKYNDGTFDLVGRADVSKVKMTYSESAKMYFVHFGVSLPNELNLADDRYVFDGGVESSGIYFVTINSISGKTMTLLVSAMNNPGEVPIMRVGFRLAGRWK